MKHLNWVGLVVVAMSAAACAESDVPAEAEQGEEDALRLYAPKDATFALGGATLTVTSSKVNAADAFARSWQLTLQTPGVPPFVLDNCRTAISVTSLTGTEPLRRANRRNSDAFVMRCDGDAISRARGDLGAIRISLKIKGEARSAEIEYAERAAEDNSFGTGLAKPARYADYQKLKAAMTSATWKTEDGPAWTIGTMPLPKSPSASDDPFAERVALYTALRPLLGRVAEFLHYDVARGSRYTHVGALTGIVVTLGSKESNADVSAVELYRDEPDGEEIGKGEVAARTRTRGVQLSVAEQVAEIARLAKLK